MLYVQIRIYPDCPPKLAELYGYAMAAAHLRLRHLQLSSYAVSSPGTASVGAGTSTAVSAKAAAEGVGVGVQSQSHDAAVITEGWSHVDALPKVCNPPNDTTGEEQAIEGEVRGIEYAVHALS